MSRRERALIREREILAALSGVPVTQTGLFAKLGWTDMGLFVKTVRYMAERGDLRMDDSQGAPLYWIDEEVT